MDWLEVVARSALFAFALLVVVLVFRVLRAAWRGLKAGVRAAGRVRATDAVAAAGYITGRAEQKASHLVGAFKQGRKRSKH